MEIRKKLFNKIFDGIDEVISLFYPNRCASCREIIENDRYLCPACEKSIERFASAKRCMICGLDKENCDCKKYIYYFDGAVAVFKNEDIARKAMYSYKLARRIGHVSFLAQETALTVKKEFKSINFDIIVAVPTTVKSRFKYGFSPVNELCFALEELLGVKFSRNILKCRSSKKPQHKSTFSERLENVRDKFYCDGRINGKTVLLVDDIKTSGATLSECARKLKFAGAEKVYCVTTLAGLTHKKKR